MIGENEPRTKDRFMNNGEDQDSKRSAKDLNLDNALVNNVNTFFVNYLHINNEEWSYNHDGSECDSDICQDHA